MGGRVPKLPHRVPPDRFLSGDRAALDQPINAVGKRWPAAVDSKRSIGVGISMPNGSLHDAMKLFLPQRIEGIVEKAVQERPAGDIE